MKGTLTTIIAGTMLAVSGATLPASAIVSNAVSQQSIYENRTPPPPSYGNPTPSQQMDNLPIEQPIQISQVGGIVIGGVKKAIKYVDPETVEKTPKLINKTADFGEAAAGKVIDNKLMDCSQQIEQGSKKDLPECFKNEEQE